MTKARGFTLLELVVIIAVIGILAAAVTPTVMNQIMDTRVDATEAEARSLYEAMVGAPTSDGTRFGFVGDIGRLPGSLIELTTQGGLPSYGTGNVRSIGMGWRGPYINSGSSATDYQRDAFGRGYVLSAGQVRSYGPDGIGNNSDDIVYPPSAPIIAGTVSVTMKTIVGGKTVVDPAGYRVDLYYANSGAQASVSDSATPITFSNVPMGLHAVRVVKTVNPGAGSVMVEDTLVVRPGTTNAVELWF
jgi:prepilin-type N-terminal cleavage/methylation domain-containing protein